MKQRIATGLNFALFSAWLCLALGACQNHEASNLDESVSVQGTQSSAEKNSNPKVHGDGRVADPLPPPDAPDPDRVTEKSNPSDPKKDGLGYSAITELSAKLPTQYTFAATTMLNASLEEQKAEDGSQGFSLHAQHELRADLTEQNGGAGSDD